MKKNDTENARAMFSPAISANCKHYLSSFSANKRLKFLLNSVNFGVNLIQFVVIMFYFSFEVKAV